MHAEIEKIREKMTTAPWPKFLRSIQISGLRGWTGREVRFQFPVTVITGENGTGKSTILKAAAAAYSDPVDAQKTYFPSNFFPDSAWEKISGVILKYNIREGDADRTIIISKPTERWRVSGKGKPKRHVILQDVSRTLPIEATVGYSRISHRKAKETSSEKLSSQFHSYYSAVLGRKYEEAKFAKSNLDSSRQVGVVKWQGKQYSQFHQGAGEDSTLDLMLLLQNVPDTSLILIDEVEASLHPRAQRRLVHFLLWLSRTKHIQVIMSTHSTHVLEELPPEARMLLLRSDSDTEIMYGVSSSFALNRMDDYAIPTLYIFVEDEQSQVLVDQLLRVGEIDMTGIVIMPVGPSDVVKALGIVAEAQKLPVPAISIVDADEQPTASCLALPGDQAPERQVFSDILNSGINDLATRLALSPQSVQHELQNAMTLPDHHGWPDQAARLLNNQTTSYLWNTMCQVWVSSCCSLDCAKQIRDKVTKIKKK